MNTVTVAQSGGLTYDLYSAPAQEWFSVADIAAVARLARRYGSVAAMESALARLDLAVPALEAPAPPSSRWFPRQAWSGTPRRMVAWTPAAPIPPPPGWSAWPGLQPSGWRPPAPVEVQLAEPRRPEILAMFTWGVSWRFLLAGIVAGVLLGGTPHLPVGWLQLGAVTFALGGLVLGLWRRGGAAGAVWRSVMVALAVVGAVGFPPLLAYVLVFGVGLCLVEPAVGAARRSRRGRVASPGWS